MNRVIIPNLYEEFSGGHRLFGLSRFDLDDNIDGLNSYYSVRMMDNAAEKIEKPYMWYEIEYLVLEQVDSEDLAEAEGQSAYKRMGRLSIMVDPEDDFMKPYPITPDATTPYPDIFLDKETPLLTNGQWREIILI